VKARVLIVSPSDLSQKLAKTILWRADIERFFADTAEEGFEKALALKPSLALIDASVLKDALTLLKRLRSNEATRKISLVAISGSTREAREDPLRHAGANLVLPVRLDTAIFDRRLEGLLEVPPRREIRLSASFQLWCRSEAAGPLQDATVLNMSIRGMLIETREPLPVGTTVEIRLPLPGDPEPLALMALVEREAQAPAGRFRCGVHFLILRDQARERIRSYLEAEGTR
jgi:CheY-like chemotaxis protein